MAKRVSPEEKMWNPVESRLAQETLSPSIAAQPAPSSGLNLAPSPAPDDDRVVKLADHRDPATDAKKPARPVAKKPEGEEVEKLSREKRVLLTESEEETLEQLVRDMGKKLKTPLKLSHMLRATTVLLMHSHEELIKQSEKMGGMKRPPNNDPVALANFEHNLARLIDRAIRGSRVFE